jgi:hypothetical protein
MKPIEFDQKHYFRAIDNYLVGIDRPTFLDKIYPTFSTKMRESLKQKIIEVCDSKIEQKGENVGLSFYAFFTNKNDNPELLMEAAKWWIMTHKLDHFEKAVKIKTIIEKIDSEK